MPPRRRRTRHRGGEALRQIGPGPFRNLDGRHGIAPEHLQVHRRRRLTGLDQGRRQLGPMQHPDGPVAAGRRIRASRSCPGPSSDAAQMPLTGSTATPPSPIHGRISSRTCASSHSGRGIPPG